MQSKADALKALVTDAQFEPCGSCAGASLSVWRGCDRLCLLLAAGGAASGGVCGRGAPGARPSAMLCTHCTPCCVVPAGLCCSWGLGGSWAAGWVKQRASLGVAAPCQRPPALVPHARACCTACPLRHPPRCARLGPGSHSSRMGAGSALPAPLAVLAVLQLCICPLHMPARAQGQARKTGEPYVAHCIETALIVEELLSPTEEDARWVGGWVGWRVGGRAAGQVVGWQAQGEGNRDGQVAAGLAGRRRWARAGSLGGPKPCGRRAQMIPGFQNAGLRASLAFREVRGAWTRESSVEALCGSLCAQAGGGCDRGGAA